MIRSKNSIRHCVILLLLVVCTVADTNPDQIECGNSALGDSPMWIRNGGSILIILGILAMFWGLNFICVEYCVPAISILCMRNMISETFAGSTIIGAGLSLPVLLASYTAMFVSNADIGIGTVLGGNIFNQTINYAFSIYVAPNRRLKLCKVTLARETVLYLVSNFIIIWILDEDLHNSVQIINAKTGLVSCVLIAWPYSLALVLCFCVYCLIEAYFDGIVRVLVRCWRRGTVHISEAPTSSSPQLLSQDDIIEENVAISMPSSCSHGLPSSIPSINYFGDDECVRQSKSDGSSACHVSNTADNLDGSADRKDSSTGLKATSEGDIEGGTKSTDNDPMVDNVSDFRLFVKDDTFAFFNFFDEVWQKRHCTLHADSCMSFRTKKESERVGNHVTFVDLSHRSALCITSEINMEFAIKASYPLSRTFYCKALDIQSFNAVTRALAVMSLNSEDITDPERLLAASQSFDRITSSPKHDWGHTGSSKCFGANVLRQGTVGITAFRCPKASIPKALYYLVHPIRVAVYYTVPDVRSKSDCKRVYLCVIMSIVWLALASYIIVLGLEEVGYLFRVNGSALGLTIGAWAASYPALWSSVTVAKEGQGDVVSCNALGSNIFSNYIGLGLPWLTYSMVHRAPAYASVKDGGVLLAIMLLNFAALMFYIVIALNDFQLRLWMGHLLCLIFVIYVSFLCYQVS